MYNCAHPGSSNEIVTVEFGKRIGEKLFFQKVLDLLIVTLDWVKYTTYDGMGQ